MKLTIDRDKLSAGLAAVSGVVKGRTTLPILQSVLMRADPADGVVLTATNLDCTITTRVAAKVEKQGGLCLPAKRFADAVRVAAAETIDIETDEKHCAALKSGSSAFKVKGVAADEFHQITKLKDGKEFSISEPVLSPAIKQTAYAQSQDKSRYVLLGILFSMVDGLLTLVATDGRRLALAKASGGSSADVNFILPTEAVAELRRVFAGYDGVINIAATDNMASFSAGGTTLTTKLVEGTFPNYKQVIPSDVKESVTVNREELIASVERARVMTSDKQISVRLNFGKNLVISAAVSDFGEASDSLAINYKGKPITIACNPEYLLDFAGSVEDKEITLGISSELEPIKVTAKDTFGVIMPVRLQ